MNLKKNSNEFQTPMLPKLELSRGLQNWSEKVRKKISKLKKKKKLETENWKLGLSF